MLTLLTGLAAGAAHVVSGPDHLAALAPIAADQPARAARIGLRWGIGHGLGVLVLGGLGAVAKAWINVDAISAWAEFCVGFLLVAVGLWSVRRALRITVHSHGHSHDEDHAHYHVHDMDADHDAPGAHAGHSHAAFAVGLLHGVAGTGHLFGVLPSLALPPAEAAVYLAAYFVAAVAAMAGFGALMGTLTRGRSPRVLKNVMLGTSGAAVVIGVYWLVTGWPA